MADGARTGGEQQRWDWLDPEIADSTKVLVALGADAIGYDSHQLQPIHADDAMGRWLGETVGSQLRRLHAKADHVEAMARILSQYPDWQEAFGVLKPIADLTGGGWQMAQVAMDAAKHAGRFEYVAATALTYALSRVALGQVRPGSGQVVVAGQLRVPQRHRRGLIRHDDRP